MSKVPHSGQSLVHIRKFRHIGLEFGKTFRIDDYILCTAFAFAKGIGHIFPYNGFAFSYSIVAYIRGALAVVGKHLPDNISVIKNGSRSQV